MTSTHTLRRPPIATPALYAQDGKGYQALVYAHYFVGSNDWFVTEYDPAQDLAFGWACLGGDRHNAELGYVFLGELETIRVPLTMYVALDSLQLQPPLPSSSTQVLSIMRNISTGTVNTVGQLSVEYETNWQPTPLEDAIKRIS